MQWWQALLIGFVQGVGEFLPISSSGHLVVGYRLLGMTQEPVVLTVILHVFTLLAVVMYFHRQIAGLKKTDWLMIGVATIPASIVGLSFKNQISEIFSSLLAVGIFFCLTGLINILASCILKHRLSITTQSLWQKPNWRQALMIGLAQTLAILPGMSRSGITVFAGLIVGAKEKAAFNFSFLISVPVIIGAFFLELLTARKENLFGDFSLMWLLSGVVAFLSGIISLKLFASAIKTNKFNWLGIYTVVLGLMLILVELF